jgi:hypothetical protein
MAATGSSSAEAEIPAPLGTWSGVLDADMLRLRLKLDFASDKTATLFSLDQGRELRPGRVTLLSADQIEIEFPTISAVFSARVIAPDRMEDEWRQNGSNLPLVFNRGEGSLLPPPPASARRRHWSRVLPIPVHSAGMRQSASFLGSCARPAR